MFKSSINVQELLNDIEYCQENLEVQIESFQGTLINADEMIREVAPPRWKDVDDINKIENFFDSLVFFRNGLRKYLMFLRECKEMMARQKKDMIDWGETQKTPIPLGKIRGEIEEIQRKLQELIAEHKNEKRLAKRKGTKTPVKKPSVKKPAVKIPIEIDDEEEELPLLTTAREVLVEEEFPVESTNITEINRDIEIPPPTPQDHLQNIRCLSLAEAHSFVQRKQDFVASGVRSAVSLPEAGISQYQSSRSRYHHEIMLLSEIKKLTFDSDEDFPVIGHSKSLAQPAIFPIDEHANLATTQATIEAVILPIDEPANLTTTQATIEHFKDVTAPPADILIDGSPNVPDDVVGVPSRNQQIVEVRQQLENVNRRKVAQRKKSSTIIPFPKCLKKTTLINLRRPPAQLEWTYNDFTAKNIPYEIKLYYYEQIVGRYHRATGAKVATQDPVEVVTRVQMEDEILPMNLEIIDPPPVSVVAEQQIANNLFETRVQMEDEILPMNLEIIEPPPVAVVAGQQIANKLPSEMVQQSPDLDSFMVRQRDPTKHSTPNVSSKLSIVVENPMENFPPPQELNDIEDLNVAAAVNQLSDTHIDSNLLNTRQQRNIQKIRQFNREKREKYFKALKLVIKTTENGTRIATIDEIRKKYTRKDFSYFCHIIIDLQSLQFIKIIKDENNALSALSFIR